MQEVKLMSKNGKRKLEAPGTLALVFIFLVFFVLLYFVNWMLLNGTWAVR